MLKNILIVTIVLLFTIICLWSIAKRIRRISRKADFQSYWDTFNDPVICENAREFYDDGMHVHEKYGVSFSEIGCTDEFTFRRAAIHSLERTLAALYETENTSSPSFNDRAIKIRAGIASLKRIDLGEDAVANIFVTA